MSNHIYIYTLAYPDTNEIFYVGSTKNVQGRAFQHNSALGFMPVIEELECIASEQDRAAIEAYWICQIAAWGFSIKNVKCNNKRSSHSIVSRKNNVAFRKDMSSVLTNKALRLIKTEPDLQISISKHLGITEAMLLKMLSRNKDLRLASADVIDIIKKHLAVIKNIQITEQAA